MTIDIKKTLERSKKRIRTYNNILNESERTFRELNSQNMQATLIQFEDFLDSNNIYAFDNWFEGVIWEGPNLSRYWVEVVLKYPHELMPQPIAIERLIDMGVIVSFKEDIEFVAIDVQSPTDLDPLTRKPKEEEKQMWLVSLKIPRRLIEDPMPNDTEEFDNLQNRQATDQAEAEEKSEVEEDGSEEISDDELEL